MKKYLFFALLLFAGFSVQAQEEHPDVVTLQNGSILRGEILKFETDGVLELKVSEDQILTLDASTVTGVQFDAKQSKFNKLFKEPFLREKGFFGTADIGALPGIQDGSGTVGLSFGFGGYYQFNRWVGVGGGVSFDGLFPKVFIPVYAAYRSYLLPTSTSPFASLRVGYGIPIEADENIDATGGLYLQPTLGIRKKSSNRTFLTAEMGVKYQWAKYDLVNWWGEQVVQKVRFGRIVMSIGMEF